MNINTQQSIRDLQTWLEMSLAQLQRIEQGGTITHKAGYLLAKLLLAQEFTEGLMAQLVQETLPGQPLHKHIITMRPPTRSPEDNNG